MASETLDSFQEAIDNSAIHFEVAHAHIDLPGPSGLFPFGFTKFMLLETFAFVIILAMFLPMAKRITTRGESRGRFAAFCEFLLIFIRDQVAKQGIGHDYRKFLPFLWTIFLFVLVMNLLGMVPFMGSPTASLAVTGTLAFICF